MHDGKVARNTQSRVVARSPFPPSLIINLNIVMTNIARVVDFPPERSVKCNVRGAPPCS